MCPPTAPWRRPRSLWPGSFFRPPETEEAGSRSYAPDRLRRRFRSLSGLTSRALNQLGSRSQSSSSNNNNRWGRVGEDRGPGARSTVALRFTGELVGGNRIYGAFLDDSVNSLLRVCVVESWSWLVFLCCVGIVGSKCIWVSKWCHLGRFNFIAERWIWWIIPTSRILWWIWVLIFSFSSFFRWIWHGSCCSKVRTSSFWGNYHWFGPHEQ